MDKTSGINVDDWTAEPAIETKRADEVEDVLASVGVTREAVENKAAPPAMASIGDVFSSIPIAAEAVIQAATTPTPAVSDEDLDAIFGASSRPSESATTADAADIVASAEKADMVEWTPEEREHQRTVLNERFTHYREAYYAFDELDIKKKAIETALAVKMKPLLDDREAKKKALSAIETEVRGLLVNYAEHSGDKKPNEYLEAKAFSTYIIEDTAAATTWAETTYPAAINKELDIPMVIKHLQNLPKGAEIPAWARLNEGFTANIAKKFPPPELDSQELPT